MPALATLTAVLVREGRLFVAHCPQLGIVSQGTTVDDALANLKEATELYLEEFHEPIDRHPIVTTFEVSSEVP